jgi:two-component system chemotaxis response regulator CheB
MPADPPLSVLVVDDTAIFRKLLFDAVSTIPGVNAVAPVASGELALKRLATGGVDLVLLDIVMPGLSGPETFREIRRLYPDVSVVLVSGVTGADALVTIRALEEGALDFIAKPQGDSFENAARLLASDLRRVVNIANTRRTMAAARAGGPCIQPFPIASPAPDQPPAPVPLQPLPTRAELIVIGVSTGGPRALAEVIPQLPADFSCPVLIVQHMPPLFTASLAGQLSRDSKLAVREAAEGERIAQGSVLIAPGGSHLVVRRDVDGTLRTSINTNPPVNSCRPSVDVLFHSVATQAPQGVVAVILTGMGEDGASGVAALKGRGARCIAQDAKSCVVYGMPQAVISRGLADEILPLAEIGRRLASFSKPRLGHNLCQTSKTQ